MLGADALSETLAMRDELTVQPQDDSQATFAPLMKKQDGAIDWNLAAREISNRVRGFQPFPTSYTKYQGRKLTILKAKPVISEQSKPGNGLIIEAKGDKLYVACGSQTLLQIDELQLEGKKKMATRDFLNGVKLQTGDILG